MVKKVLKIVLSVALAAALLYFAFRGIDWSAFWNGLKETNLSMMSLYTVVAVLALVFRQVRWRRMLLPFDKNVRRLDVWDAINVGNVVNVVLPGAGELVRCGYVSKGGLKYEKAFGSIVSERACDFIAVGLLFVGALAGAWDKFGAFFRESLYGPMAERMERGVLWWILAGVLCVCIVCGWFVVHFKSRFRICEKIYGLFSGLWSGFSTVFRTKGAVGFAASTVGIWLMYILMSYFTMLAIPSLSGLRFIDALFISAVGNVASVIPVPGGIGAYHYLIALTLQSIYGIPWETGVLFATLGHEAHAIIILLLGAVSYGRLCSASR